MFQTVHYEIQSDKINSPVKIVMLADLHNYLHGASNRELMEEIRRTAPDFVCIAGDMLIGNSMVSHEVAQNCVLDLAKDYPVFYGLGNHEARMKIQREIYGNKYEDYMAPIRSAGVFVLENQKRVFRVRENEFTIYGYDLPMKYFEKFNRYPFEVNQLTEALGSSQEDDSYRILIAHNPVYFKQYAAWGADLTLSGHLHGGIIRLPLIGGIITPQAKLFPRFSAGKYHIGNRHLIVSRGLGTHTIPIRFHNPPELSVIHLKSTKI
ncbi:MAG: metallophosphoesterase [Lachnospiraceae bacterium]